MRKLHIIWWATLAMVGLWHWLTLRTAERGLRVVWMALYLVSFWCCLHVWEHGC